MSLNLFSTGFPSLDGAQVRSKLRKFKNDESQFRTILVDAFFDGSTAAAEAAALYVISTTATDAEALALSDILKSLPTAVSVRAAPALARCAVYLATSFETPGQETSEPLLTFSYAQNSVRQEAAHAALGALDTTAREQPTLLKTFLRRTKRFFSELLGRRCGIQERFVTLRGIVNVGLHSSSVSATIVDFVLEVSGRAEQKTYEESDEKEEEESQEENYESFFATELINLANDTHSIARILRMCLINSFEKGSIKPLFDVWMCRKAKLLQGLNELGVEEFVVMIVTIAGVAACSGKLTKAGKAMMMARNIMSESRNILGSMSEVSARLLLSLCTSIQALSHACGANEYMKCASSLGSTVKHIKWTQTAKPDRFSMMFEEAVKLNLNSSTLFLGILHTVVPIWNNPRALKGWMELELFDMLSSDEFNYKKSEDLLAQLNTSDERMSKFARDSYLDSIRAPTTTSIRCTNLVLTLAAASVPLTCLSHTHPQVRYAAINVFRRLQDERVMIFFLPCFVMRLEHETNGAISMACLVQILLSPSLLSDSNTCKVVIQTLLAIMHRCKTSSSTFQGCLVALASATRVAPNIVTPVLLKEMDNLNSSFDLLTSATKTAACAAIFELVVNRPARGPAFIPLIKKMLTVENMQVAPVSVGIAFRVMERLCAEQILDALKAVKIVLKAFPSVSSVNALPRRSFLALIGAVSPYTTTKKGRSLAEKVLNILRDVITNFNPVIELQTETDTGSQLSWTEIAEVANSLQRFSPEEILLLGISSIDPLPDPEEELERLEIIANHSDAFTEKLLVLSDASREPSPTAHETLQALVTYLVDYEWQNRRRSKFDPNRLAKMREASEKLRRSRGEPEENIRAIFLRSVRSLPVGAVRRVCENCSRIGTSTKISDAKTFSKCAAAFEAAAKTGIRDGGLPWARLICEVLAESEDVYEKVAALSLLNNIKKEDYDANVVRAAWFGAKSPLFDGNQDLDQKEIQVLFSGMLKWFPNDAANFLAGWNNHVEERTIISILNAARELKCDEDRKAHEDVTFLLVEVCERLQDASEIVLDDLSEMLNTFTPSLFIERLAPSQCAEMSPADRFKIRLACRMNCFPLLKLAVKKCLSSKETTLVIEVGHALWRRGEGERKDIVYDVTKALLSGKEYKRAGEKLIGYCVGRGAITGWFVPIST